MKLHKYVYHQRLHIVNKVCHSDSLQFLSCLPIIGLKNGFDLAVLYCMDNLNETSHICIYSMVTS